MDESQRENLENQVCLSLKEVSKNFHVMLSLQQKCWSRLFQLAGKINDFSNRVFWHLGRGDVDSAQETLDYCKQAYKDLCLLPLPDVHKAEKVSVAGQELTKASLALALYPVLTSEQNLDEVVIPTNASLEVSAASWINGVTDFSGESGKLCSQIRFYQVSRSKLPINDAELCERQVAIVEGIQKYLDSFSSVLPTLLNTSHHYDSDYRSKRRGVSASIGKGIEEVNNLTYGEIRQE